MIRVTELAPAKVNLFLHITSKRDDGYHELISWCGFTPDIADQIIISPCDEFRFTIDGAFGRKLTADGDNLVTKAACGLADLLGKTLNCHIHLVKNLPLEAGIGGGSADAAATIRGLLRFWDTQLSDADLMPLLTSLGADVPVCYRARSALMSGIGDQLNHASALPALYILLVNPLKPCPTPPIFKALDLSTISDQVKAMPPIFKDVQACLRYIAGHNNDLCAAAMQVLPEIGDALHYIAEIEGCELARMSGSGATCFGLFASENLAKKACTKIQADHPNWWAGYSELV